MTHGAPDSMYFSKYLNSITALDRIAKNAELNVNSGIWNDFLSSSFFYAV